MLRAAAVGILLTLGASSQTKRPTIEVASVKPCQDTGGGARGGRKGGGGGPAAVAGHLNLNCMTVAQLIRSAYLLFADGAPPTLSGPRISQRMLNQPLTGAPAWIDSERYTIDAKPEAPQTVPMMRGPMLQALLEDRFQLKLHREAREVPVYALTQVKSGAKLSAVEKGKCMTEDEFRASIEANGAPPMPGDTGFKPICGAVMRNREGVLTGFGITMTALCNELSRVLDRDVVDRTGFLSTFDFQMQLAPADALIGLTLNGAPMAPAPDPNAPAPDPAGSSVFPAVQKLGLHLEPAKGSAEFLVIDRIARPSGN
jgi:uncharacterized protein (TIGR03435 family)